MLNIYQHFIHWHIHTVSHSLDNTDIRLMRNNPVDTIFRQTILFCDSSRDIRHVGYSIFKYCSSFLVQIVHFIVYCEIRRRTNRTTSFHVEERQTFAICSQYRIHDSVIFRSGLHHKGSSTITENRACSTICIVNH